MGEYFKFKYKLHIPKEKIVSLFELTKELKRIPLKFYGKLKGKNLIFATEKEYHAFSSRVRGISSLDHIKSLKNLIQ